MGEKNFHHLTWRSPEALDNLEGYALAVCVRLYATRDRSTGGYKYIGQRVTEPPSVLTPEVTDFVSIPYAFILDKIRANGSVKSEEDVMDLLASLENYEEFATWRRANKDRIKAVRERLRRLEPTKQHGGFVCYGP